MRRAILAVMVVLTAALIIPSVVHAQSQDTSPAELQVQIQALADKVAALNAALSNAVSQIAALATVMVTLQAQMATGHGAISSQAVLAALPPPNKALPVPSVLPEITRSLGLPARQVPVEDAKAEQQASPRLDQYRFLGYLLQNGESYAFLGKGSELYIVRTGETVDGRLQVTAIDAASVKLLDPSTSQETTLALTTGGSGVF